MSFFFILDAPIKDFNNFLTIPQISNKRKTKHEESEASDKIVWGVFFETAQHGKEGHIMIFSQMYHRITNKTDAFHSNNKRDR